MLQLKNGGSFLKDKKLILKAKNIAEARKKASLHFEVAQKSITVKVIKPPFTLFGIRISPMIARATIKKEAPQPDIDGSFDFEYSNEGVYLIINTASGKGRNVTENEILNKVAAKRIKEADKDAAANAILNKLAKTIIAPPQIEELIDEQAIITISDDSMEAFIEFVREEGGKKLTDEGIKNAVAKSGVSFGLDVERLSQLAQSRACGEKIKIAAGKNPENGKDGVLEYQGDFETSQIPTYLENGSVDYYERKNFFSVKTGQIIAIYHKAVKGLTGKNVLGEDISAYDGKELPLPVGKNVIVSEDGNNITADTDGIVEIRKGKICVSDVLIINGDVDLSIGNINVPGNLKITGNVASCISITVSGSVEIMGTVEAATITAEGNVNIKQGVSGADKAVIKAGKNVAASFIENATVFAGQNIVANSIINSNVECMDSIIAAGTKGVIYGGKVKATNKVSAQTIGSPADIPTVIEVGVSPKIKTDYNQIINEISGLQRELAYISNVIDLAKGELTQRQAAIKKRLFKTKLDKMEQLDKCETKKRELENLIGKETVGSINISNTANIGCVIIIKTLNYAVKEVISHTTFKIVDGEITPLPYQK